MKVEMLRMQIEDLFCLYDLTGYRSKITILHNLRLTILKTPSSEYSKRTKDSVNTEIR